MLAYLSGLAAKKGGVELCESVGKYVRILRWIEHREGRALRAALA